MTNSLFSALSLSVARESDRPALEQLWTMFRHDMSAYSGAFPDARGRFRQERLDRALADDAWRCYLVRLGETPAGFCIVRNIGSPERIISSFFLINAARRRGHGRALAHRVTGTHRGDWAVAFQEANSAAAAFWPTVAAAEDPDWSFTRESVPGRPELPADAWIRFRVSRKQID